MDWQTHSLRKLATFMSVRSTQHCKLHSKLSRILRRFLELQSSGRKNEIRLHYRHKNIMFTETFPYNLADGYWHQLAVSVSPSSVELYVDCSRIYKKLIHEIDRDFFAHPALTLWLGQRDPEFFLFKVRILLSLFALPTQIQNFYQLNAFPNNGIPHYKQFLPKLRVCRKVFRSCLTKEDLTFMNFI